MGKSTTDVCEIVTNKVIAELEKGIIPWKKPWFSTEGLGGAFNRITKHPYSLLNQLLLGKSGEYASMKQWNELGGKIRKGEKGNLVTFWKSYPREVTTTNENGEEIKKVKAFWVLRYYYVYHIDQVEGVEPLDIKAEEKKRENKPIEEAERVMNGYISHENIKLIRARNSDKAFYSPISDQIVVPTMKQFRSAEDFYDVAFHEMTHSTGNPKRLNRFEADSAVFGSEDYSKEELVAEIGSAVLASMVGTSTEKTEKNNAAYIQSWLRALKDDSKMIISAAGKAEKAVNFILEAANATEIPDAKPSGTEAVANAAEVDQVDQVDEVAKEPKPEPVSEPVGEIPQEIPDAEPVYEKAYRFKEKAAAKAKAKRKRTKKTEALPA